MREMEEKPLALIVGGDRRQLACGQVLQQAGWQVECLGFDRAQLPAELRPAAGLERLREAGLALFPLGKKALPLEDCWRRLPPGCKVFAGKLQASEEALARELDLEVLDYFRVESFTVGNALLTAEGAVQLALEALPQGLWGTPVLLCGFGRIGRGLLPRLLGLGARVTVAARREEQRLWAREGAAEAVDFSQLKGVLPQTQLLINTVPQPILREKQLKLLPQDCLLLELASAPYGIPREAAEALGLRYILGAGLPGKLRPQRAGELIAQCILSSLREENDPWKNAASDLQ